VPAVIASEAKQSNFSFLPRLSFLLPFGLLRGACHRAALCADPLARNDGGTDYFASHSSIFAWISMDNATDIPRSRRYINPARQHVRAFGVCIGIEKMTGTTRSSGGLDDRRKRLLFRCWHRGTREMDLIFGRFADAEIANLSENELAQFEYLMDVPDPDLYAALTGNMPPAPDYANGLFDRIKSFRAESGV
jgi:antitoxin CptB